MPARQLCLKVNLKIRGVDFVGNLIVLESKGIDVILRMDWLSKHKVLIDYAKKSVKLTTPKGKKLEFVHRIVGRHARGGSDFRERPSLYSPE